MNNIFLISQKYYNNEYNDIIMIVFWLVLVDTIFDLGDLGARLPLEEEKPFGKGENKWNKWLMYKNETRKDNTHQN